MLPVELVERLSQLDDTSVEETAVKWGTTEEFTLAGWDQSAIVTVLGEIVNLARRATSEGKRLFAWMSL
jgi:hypothetical protein